MPRLIFISISISALLVIVAAAALVLMEKIPFDSYLFYVQLSTILWFVTAPFWIIERSRSKT